MRMIFLNLPTKDLPASTAFFTALGWPKNETFSDASCSSLVIEDNIVLMLLTEARFAEFVVGPVHDPRRATAALYALSADSREDVQALVAKALAAGATPWKPPMDQGLMYGHSFQDLDGHVWEVVWMDVSAATGGSQGS